MKCKCGNEAVLTKTKPRKSDGATFDVYECRSGCMNGRFKYSFFPPKEMKMPQDRSVVPTKQVDEAVVILKQILNALNIIVSKMPIGQSEAMDAVPQEIAEGEEDEGAVPF